MKILLYPGAFNPYHLGHVQAVEMAVKKLPFDEVWIMPSGNRKDKKIELSFADRRNLGRLFVDHLASRLPLPVKLITDEIEDTNVRTTEEIMPEIKAREGVECIQLIGIDGLLHLKDMVSPEVLEQESFLVINRPGFTITDDLKNRDNIIWLNEVGPDISSTQIRSLIRAGDVGYGKNLLLEIAQYIKENHLYGAKRAGL